MKTLLCTALVVLSISVCVAYQAPPAAEPPPPLSPAFRIPLPEARRNSQAVRARFPNKKRSRRPPRVLLSTPRVRIRQERKETTSALSPPSLRCLERQWNDPGGPETSSP